MSNWDDDYEYDELTPEQKNIKAWQEKNEWYGNNTKTTMAFDEYVHDLVGKGIPINKPRLDNIRSKVEEMYPEEFVEVSPRELNFNDITDPLERREALSAFKKMQSEAKISGRKALSEKEYLKHYMDY